MESDLNSEAFFKRKYFIVSTLLVLLILGLTLMSFHKTVVIAHDGQEIKVSTISSTIEGVLRKQGIEVDEDDKVIPGLKEKLQDGARIVIHRAFEINLVDAGEESRVKTAESTVADLLQALNIDLDKYDKVEPTLDTAIHEGEIVKITRVTKEILEETQEVPFQTVIKYNDDLEQDKVVQVQQGQKGLKEIKLEIIYENGIEVAREIMEENIVAEAQNEIVERGTAQYVLTSRGDRQRYKAVYTMVATGYDAGFESTGKRPGDKYYGITASGTQVRPGVVAVDPKVIPLGSKLYIESTDRTSSYGLASAEDTGSAIKGNRVDLYFENRSDALKFGRRTVKVYVLE